MRILISIYLQSKAQIEQLRHVTKPNNKQRQPQLHIQLYGQRRSLNLSNRTERENDNVQLRKERQS